MSNPRIGYDNLFHRFKDGVIVPNETVDGEGLNAFDWRPGVFWKPNRFPTLVQNGDLLLWSAGPSAAPDSFALEGAGASVARLTPSDPIAFPYTAQLTRAGADASLRQVLDGGDPASMVGLSVRGIGYARTSTAGQGRIRVTDGVGSESATHTGGGAWELLVTDPLVISQAPTSVDFLADTISVDGDVEFDALFAYISSFDDAAPLGFFEVVRSCAYVFPAEGQILRNWLMDVWSSGGSAYPDRWAALYGAETSVYRSADAKVGRYSLELDGADFAAGQEITGAALNAIKGKRIWSGVWAKTTEGSSRCRLGWVLRFRDGTLSTEIPGTPGSGGRIHSGGGAYEWLASQIDVPHDVLGVAPAFVHDSGADFTALWSGAITACQVAEPAETPHPQDVDYMAITGHNLSSGSHTVRTEGSDDNFASASLVVTNTPTKDRTLWEDIEPSPGPSNHGAFRVCNVNALGPDNRAIEIGHISIGKYLEMPCAPEIPFRPLNESFQSQRSSTRGNFPLGRAVSRVNKSFEMTYQMLTRAFTVGDLLEGWWAHAGRTSALPWFFQWNDSDFPEEAMFCVVPDNYQFDPNEFAGRQVRRFSIAVEAISS